MRVIKNEKSELLSWPSAAYTYMSSRMLFPIYTYAESIIIKMEVVVTVQAWSAADSHDLSVTAVKGMREFRWAETRASLYRSFRNTMI